MALYTLYLVIEEDADGGYEPVRAFAYAADAQYYERLSYVNNAERAGSLSYCTLPIVLESTSEGLPFIKF